MLTRSKPPNLRTLACSMHALVHANMHAPMHAFVRALRLDTQAAKLQVELDEADEKVDESKMLLVTAERAVEQADATIEQLSTSSSATKKSLQRKKVSTRQPFSLYLHPRIYSTAARC
jgi:hypothetical protein